jgi:hypothetical protein
VKQTRKNRSAAPESAAAVIGAPLKLDLALQVSSYGVVRMQRARSFRNPECTTNIGFGQLMRFPRDFSRWFPGVVKLTAAKMVACRWLDPFIVARIKFLEWTADDRLRLPRFAGIRSDKEAREVV